MVPNGIQKTEPFLSSGGYSEGTLRCASTDVGYNLAYFRFYRKKEASTAKNNGTLGNFFTANPMALTPLSVADLEWMHFMVTKVTIERSVLTVGPRPMVPITKNVHHCALAQQLGFLCLLSFLYFMFYIIIGVGGGVVFNNFGSPVLSINMAPPRRLL